MFIVWGRSVYRKRIGYVADFCPMCRGPQAFLMKSVKAYKHVYFVPVGETGSGFERVCQGCKITFSGTPKFYKAAKKRPLNVQDLVQSSFPSLNEVYGDRLRIEDAVRKDPAGLPQDIRAALLRQPFSVVSPLVQARFGQQTRFDTHAVLALVFALVGALMAGKIAEVAHSDNSEMAFLAVGGLGLAYFVWALFSEPWRYVKRFITPCLARALSPLQPTETEMTTVLAELKKSRQRLGRHLRASRLMKAVAAASLGARRGLFLG
jgi:hypothetical protein